MSTIHSTSDWDETTCDLSIWEEIPEGDEVIDESFNPAINVPTHQPCKKCYPPDGTKQRAALYAAADAKRIQWAKQQETLAVMLAEKGRG